MWKVFVGQANVGGGSQFFSIGRIASPSNFTTFLRSVVLISKAALGEAFSLMSRELQDLCGKGESAANKIVGLIEGRAFSLISK
jgi:hypothetical protein